MMATNVYAQLGLRRNPFPPTPDASCYFFTPQLEEAFAEISHCILARKGFVLLTGEVGLGKTTLVRRLLDGLPSEQFLSALVFNTFLQEADLLNAILSDFGLDAAASLEAGLAQINRFLLQAHQSGRTCLLVIDDAQNLSVPSLELIRLLCNLETDQEKLLQILLVGQPELDERLADAHLRQLKSRIVKHARLSGLQRSDVGRYFDFRINFAGGAGRLRLSPKGADALFACTVGNLRLLHQVLDRCLYGLVATEQSQISAELVRRAALEVPGLNLTGRSLGAGWSGRSWIWMGAGAGALVLLASVGWGVLKVQASPTPEALTQAPRDPTPVVHAWTSAMDAKHETVIRVQRLLRRQGLLADGDVDGLFGPRTAQALRQFQQTQGLPPTGQIDELTLMRLENDHVEKSSAR